MPKKKRKAGKKFDVRSVTALAAKLVQENQDASYAFLQGKLKIGIGSISKVLKRLEVKGIVRRGLGRRWVVLVNVDGSKKPDADVPEKRRFKKRRVRRSAAPVAPAIAEASANGHAIGTDEKVSLLERLADVAGKEKTKVLRAIIDDVKSLNTNRKVIAALQ